jgi:hypothetical protein
VAVAAEGLTGSGRGGGFWVVLELLLCRSDVEIRAEGAAAIMGAGPDCWLISPPPVPEAGAVAVTGDVCPVPVTLTGAESVAKEPGDPMRL